MDEEKSVPQTEESRREAAENCRRFYASRFAPLLVLCCMAMTAMASATSGEGSGSDSGLSAITGAFSTVTRLVSSVFELITGNPLLAVFVAIGLFGSGIGLFRKLRRAAH